MFPTDKALREMIEQAMLTKAPSLHASLKASGELRAEIDQRMKLAKESYLEAVGTQPKAATLEAQQKPMLDQQQQRTTQQRAAAAEALEQATEFLSESETDETTSPLPEA